MRYLDEWLKSLSKWQILYVFCGNLLLIGVMVALLIRLMGQSWPVSCLLGLAVIGGIILLLLVKMLSSLSEVRR